MKKCCVIKGCGKAKGRSKNTSFHIFPKDDVLKRKWIKNIENLNKQRVEFAENSVICQDHFEKRFLRKDWSFSFQRLAKNAIPTLFPNLDSPETIKTEMVVEPEQCGDGYFEECNPLTSVLSVEDCEDSQIIENDHNSIEMCSDGYFEESNPNSSELHSSDEEYDKCESRSSGQNSSKQCKIKNLMEKESKDNFKCGEIFWSKAYNCYLYTCSMCHATGFKTLTYHYKKCHALLNESEKNQSQLSKNEGKNTLVSGKVKSIELEVNETHKQELEVNQIHKKASEQLKNLPKEFYKQNNHVEILKTQTTKIPLVCIYCNKKFLKLEDLKTHHVKHSGAKPFICKFCGSSFTDYDKKQRHELQHIEMKNQKERS